MDTFNYLSTQFEIINNTQGLNAKIDRVKDALDSKYKNEFIRSMKIAMSPDIKTGISRCYLLKFEKEFNGLPTLHYQSFEAIAEAIENNDGKKISKDKICETYLAWKNSSSNHIAQFLYYLITKDCPIGIGDSILRKTIPNFRDKFEIQLGSRIDDDKIDWNREAFFSEKYDGVNCTAIKENESVRFFARSGKEIFNLLQLTDEYLTLPNGVYCGELLYSGECKDREEMFRLTSGEVNSKRESKQLLHRIFDYVPLSDWKSKKATWTYSQEIAFLNETLKNTTLIKPVEIFYRGTGKCEVMRILNKVKEEGKEGLMMRYSSSVYEFKRSKSLIKLKKFYTQDLKVIDYKEFKNPGLLGAFIVDYKGSPVSVGSGFSEEQRIEFWKDREKYIGKIIEVKAMEETTDSSGKHSLRFPTFIRVRDDKDTPSYH